MRLDKQAYISYMKTELWYCHNDLRSKIKDEAITSDWRLILNLFNVEVNFDLYGEVSKTF